MFACIKMFEHGSLQNESFLPMCSVMEQPDGVASTAYIVRYYCQLPRCLCVSPLNNKQIISNLLILKGAMDPQGCARLGEQSRGRNERD